VELYTVGVDQAKLLVLTQLKTTARGPGYVHLPSSVDDEYLAQLTGEALGLKMIRGLAVHEWHATRPRVEGLDCAVLNLATLRFLQPRWAVLAEQLGALSPPVPAAPPSSVPDPVAPDVPPPPRPPAVLRRVSHSAYLGR
jgi:phage terminase large subunit GpA-like protein